MRARLALLFAVVIAGWLWLDARAQTNAPIVSGAHRFEKIAEGIYYATASGTMQVGANSPIIVTDSEAIVIDSETSPAAGRALVQDIKAFTDNPVKYVIDSHFHYDHLFGNQIFGPDVQIIGHDHTRERLQGEHAGAVHLSDERQADPRACRDAEAADRAGVGSAAEGGARAAGEELAGVSRAGEGDQADAAQRDVRQHDDACTEAAANCT